MRYGIRRVVSTTVRHYVGGVMDRMATIECWNAGGGEDEMGMVDAIHHVCLTLLSFETVQTRLPLTGTERSLPFGASALALGCLMVP